MSVLREDRNQMQLGYIRLSLRPIQNKTMILVDVETFNKVWAIISGTFMAGTNSRSTIKR